MLLERGAGSPFQAPEEGNGVSDLLNHKQIHKFSFQFGFGSVFETLPSRARLPLKKAYAHTHFWSQTLSFGDQDLKKNIPENLTSSPFSERTNGRSE